MARTTWLAGRRPAVVALMTPAADLFGQVYDPIREAGLTELARYSAAEIALVTEVLRRGERLQLAQAERIHNLLRSATASPASMTSSRHAALVTGRLVKARIDAQVTWLVAAHV